MDKVKIKIRCSERSIWSSQFNWRRIQVLKGSAMIGWGCTLDLFWVLQGSLPERLQIRFENTANGEAYLPGKIQPNCGRESENDFKDSTLRPRQPHILGLQQHKQKDQTSH